MKKNENLVLVGTKVILVPYKSQHVQKYHDWMASPFLQEMTASEPLTLDEEYEMQKSWHEDSRKCTFIMLALKEDDTTKAKTTKMDLSMENTVMIGDVNIFLNDCDDDLTFGEIEVMVAEELFRRRGYGLEGLKMMMAYAVKELGIKTFHAKISLKNYPSICLFKEKLAFYQVSHSEIFQEVTLEWCIKQYNDPLIASGNNQNEDDRDATTNYYGSKATISQNQSCQKLYKCLRDFWDNGIQKYAWETSNLKE